MEKMNSGGTPGVSQEWRAAHGIGLKMVALAMATLYPLWIALSLLGYWLSFGSMPGWWPL